MRKIRNLYVTLYTWLVIMLGVGLLYYTFPLLDIDLSRQLLVLAVFGVFTEWLAVMLPRGQLTGRFAVILAAYLIYGPIAAAWVNVFAILIGQGVVNRGRLLRTTLFNAARVVSALLLAGFIYILVGGATGQALEASLLWRLPVFIAVYYLSHRLFLYIYNLPERDKYSTPPWTDVLLWDGCIMLLTVPIGLSMVILYSYVGIYGSLLVFLPMLAAQFALRVYLRLRLANRELKLIYKVSWRLGASGTMHDMFNLLLRDIHQWLRFNDGVIYLWSDEQKCYLMETVWDDYAKNYMPAAILLGEGLLGRLAENGNNHIADNIREDEQALGEAPSFGRMLKSLLALPIMTRGKVLGLLVLVDKRTGFFEDRHAQVLKILARQLAEMIANEQLNRQLERVVMLDITTKLYSYRYFYHCLLVEIERAHRVKANLALILLDIDDFTQLNKRYGLSIGDFVLAEVAGLIKDLIRQEDIAARVGSDEFALLLPRANTAEARHVADMLRIAVRDYDFGDESNRLQVRVSASIAFYPDDASDAYGLLLYAQRNLRKRR